MRALAAALALFLAVCAQAQPPIPDRGVAQSRAEREAQRLAELEAKLSAELQGAARLQAERLRRLQQQPPSTDKRNLTPIAHRASTRTQTLSRTCCRR